MELTKLDYEYLQNLRLIKPYVTCIMNNRYIELIKVWLEKLSDAKYCDKTTRNEYISKLAKQLEQGVLKEPFTMYPPPVERLRDCGNNFQTLHMPVLQTPNVKQQKAAATKTRGRTRKKELNQADDVINQWRQEFEDCTRGRRHARKENALDSDSSWLDLSEDNNNSCPEMASGDAGNVDDELLNNARIQNLVRIVEQLQAENTALKQIIQNNDANQNNSDGNDEEMLSNNQLPVFTEWQIIITSLHKKLAIMQRKNGDLKNVIANLEHKLGEAQRTRCSMAPQKCAVLSELHKKELELLKQKHRQDMELLEGRLNEKCDEKLKKWYEQRLSDVQGETEGKMRVFYEKQVEDIRKEYDREIKQFYEKKRAEIAEEKRLELEAFYKDTFGKIEANDEKTKLVYEQRLQELRDEYEKEAAVKDGEIRRLEALLEEQCGRMQIEVQNIRDQLATNGDEALNEKVQFLQKCILKMDKIYKKAEKDYLKQIAKLRKEMDMRDKHNQILLTTQRVKLISSSTAMKQREIEDIVAKLEQHYKSLLIEQQSEATKERKTDRRTILELREQLAQAKSSV